MKILIAVALFAVSALAQTITVNLSVPMQAAVLADIHQHYLAQTTGTLGAISADMDATSTSLTITLDQSKLTAAAPLFVVGNAVLIGSEPMLVASANALQIGLTRGSFPNVALAAHASGAQIVLLKYTSPWEMLMDEALRPWTLGVIQALGAKSITLASGVTGAISQ